ncbi:MAG: beta-1,6-N-acetylglucosaminyltransferase [Janthinobacterium lividum]
MLAGKLHHPDCVTVVHVDKGVQAASFRKAAGNAMFVPDAQRVAVHWAGYSMVEATLAAIRHTLAIAPQTERFVLLSGSDWPVYPLDVILDRLSGPDELIRVDRRLDPEGDGWFDTCANHAYLGDNRWLNPRTMPRLVERIVRKVEGRLARRAPYATPVFYGPQWWSLTRATIDHILAELQGDPNKALWFKYARCPDEMVFQTLVKASPFADRIRHDATRGDAAAWPADLAGVHYTRFENGTASPKALGLEDLVAIRSSGALFARKMDATRSRALIQALT